MLKNKKVLVTGGAGFIGYYMIQELLKRKAIPIVFDKKNVTDPIKKVVYYRGNIVDKYGKKSSNYTMLSDVLESEGIELVIHLAAEVGVTQSVDSPWHTYETNIQGTEDVLNNARENISYNGRVILASTCAVYGEPLSIPTRETDRLIPKSPYAISKLAMETMYPPETRDRRPLVAALRYFNVFGIGQNPSYAAAIPTFIGKALQGEPIQIYGDGGQTRDFVHVVDVAKATVDALVSPDVKDNGRYNIGTGTAITILRLAQLILKMAGNSSQILTGRPRPGDIYTSLSCIDAAKDALSFSPKVTWEEGIKELMENYDG